MTTDLFLVLALLAATVVMFSLNRPRMDAVALIMMTALPLTGVLTMNEALTGFSDPAVILIATLFVIGEGLVRTGVAQRMGDLLIRRAGGSETRLIVLLMAIVGGVGAFMSSTGVVAIFIPIVMRIAQNVGLAVGRLMMPLSVAALISGMMTLVATPPNLIINSELARQGLDGFGFFAFTPFGVPILILAIAYMLFARRWLGNRPDRRNRPPKPRFSTWAREYHLIGREYRLQITPASPWGGKRLQDLQLRSTSGINILAIDRKKRFTTETLKPQAETELAPGDTIFMDVGRHDFDIDAFCHRYGLRRLPLSGKTLTDQANVIGMAELMVPASSSLVGKSVVESAFRTSYGGLVVLGLKRGQNAFEGSILDEKIRIGDTLLVAGPWAAIRRINHSDKTDLMILNMPAELDDVVPAPSRAPYAVLSLLIVVFLMVSEAVPNVQAALIGCLLMGLFRCVDLNSSYRSIHWQSLILIVGMMPFSLALQKTGGIDLAAYGLRAVLGDADPHFMLGALFAMTAVLGLFISNTATAVLMAPVAVAVASELGVSPYPFCMGVALAASAAFMTPVSSPVNTLVAGPGRYTFGDFIRIGVPFTLVVLVATMVLVPLVFPFSP